MGKLYLLWSCVPAETSRLGRKAYFRSAVTMEEVIDDGSESTITNKSMPKVANAKQKQSPDWQTFIFNVPLCRPTIIGG